MEVSAFVDTSALVVLLDPDDSRHDGAWSLWTEALRAGRALVTTSYVVVECVSVVQRRLGIEAVRVLLADLVTLLHVVWVAPEDHERGAEALLAAGRRDLSLVDCVSFAVMGRLGISTFFAYDRHYAERGFELLV